ncbi:hypothetical protein O9993_00275 [Vibrio lentus]|nr:hypothetical protein [Vibrio lentus]
MIDDLCVLWHIDVPDEELQLVWLQTWDKESVKALMYATQVSYSTVDF